MLAIGIVLGLVALMALLKSRRFVLGASLLILIPLLGFGAYAVTRSSHASLGRAAAIRQEMSLLAFDMTRDHPAFGVGIGNFRSVSRHYVTDEYPQLRRWAPRGQNAHNNFLQILGELGIPGLLAFLWLVVPVVRRWRWEPASAADTVVYASAMAAGLATFLISALFGHPLLIPQVAAAFFLVLGLTSALLPAPAAAGRVGQSRVLGRNPRCGRFAALADSRRAGGGARRRRTEPRRRHARRRAVPDRGGGVDLATCTRGPGGHVTAALGGTGASRVPRGRGLRRPRRRSGATGHDRVDAFALPPAIRRLTGGRAPTPVTRVRSRAAT